MLGNIAGMKELAASVVLIAILLGVLLVVAFDLFCLVHLAAADRVRLPAKLAWAVAIVCISPLAGAAYLLSRSRRRPRRSPGPPVPVPR
jgi:membrane protein implicated in regulation of membrane protease activity